ncbi:unnamed protein product [Adineta steineri]|uniref:Uncharacterized protein n=2 Tax=Adineta steineri TaxID=433720 RepID=A0A814A102_9BILA|nr:unnamed protein product [Adineta steineri]
MKIMIKFYLFLTLIYRVNTADDILQYKKVVTFGDSTTDSGTAYRLSNHTWPPVPPFNINGGFADDLLWNEIFTKEFLSNATLENYACGSATTDNNLAQGNMSRNPNLILNYDIRANTKSPGVRQQINQYINSITNKDNDFDNILYIIWSGTNNYYFNKTLTVLNTIESLIDCLNLLIKFGAQNLVIINEPPFDRFPAFRNKNETNQTKELYLNHNNILNKNFNENYSSSNTKVNIRLFDSYSFIVNIMNNYRNYDFENLDNCWDTITNSTIQIRCENIRKRMFCDEYHFTSQMQNLIAQEFYRVMTIERNSAFHITGKITIYFILIIFVLHKSFF